jgi:pyruvate/2-oxoacid:ferredoxin oxidoreductase beta subunit
MKVVYKRPELLTDAHFSYCGGCGHGIINKLLAEIIEEEKLSEKAILVWPIVQVLQSLLYQSYDPSSFSIFQNNCHSILHT